MKVLHLFTVVTVAHQHHAVAAHAPSWTKDFDPTIHNSCGSAAMLLPSDPGGCDHWCRDLDAGTGNVTTIANEDLELTSVQCACSGVSTLFPSATISNITNTTFCAEGWHVETKKCADVNVVDDESCNRWCVADSGYWDDAGITFTAVNNDPRCECRALSDLGQGHQIQTTSNVIVLKCNSSGAVKKAGLLGFMAVALTTAVTTIML